MQNSSSKTTPIRWKALLICPRRSLQFELKTVLKEAIDGVAVELDEYPARGVLSEIVSAQRPNICFVDVGANLDRAGPVMAEAAGLRPSLPVVAVHTGNDPDLILRCVRQGATEFLFAPFHAQAINEVLDRLAKILEADKAHLRTGKVYCVMPGKGACGASTLAANLACQLRRLSQQKLLLADMDPLTGTLSFLLKLKSNYSFVDAAAHAHEMDEDIWKGLMTPCQGFDVLLSPENPADAIAEAHDATPLVDYSREGYELTVVDAQSPYGEWNLSLARACDELLLVTTNELPALHCTRRAMAYLEQNGVNAAKIRLIVNRYNPQAGLSREAIETALHAAVYFVLPSDYEAVQKALLEGKSVPSGTALGKALSTLAERLTGHEAKPKKGSLLSGLFSMFDTAS